MRFVDLFCGCGGAGLGLLNAGLAHYKSFDNDIDAAASHRLLTGHSTTLADLSSKPICDLVGKFAGLFWMSSPCQSFSRLQRLANDPTDSRVRLFLGAFRQVLEGYEQSWLVVENVPDLIGYPAFEEAADLVLRLRGMHFYPERMRQYVLSSEFFGVPQRRARLYWIIPPNGTPVPAPLPPKGGRPLTFRDAIGPGFSDHDPESWPLTKTELSFIKARLRNGYCPANEWGTIPSTVLASKQVRLHSGMFNHPAEDRRLTVGECMAIQGLPPIKLSGSLEARYRQVGNAVPPAMAEAIGRLIISLT